MNEEQKKAIQEIAFACWEQSEKSGFHVVYLHPDVVTREARSYYSHPFRQVPDKLVLIASEVGEAVDAIRKPEWEIDKTYYTDGAKPEGLGSELADIVIRVFDLAQMVGIDIAEQISLKMSYNAKRSYRHGGKLL